MKDFFISYTEADKAWAEWIAWTLEEAGLSVIIQAWDFRPGGNFVLDMQRAASETEKTIVVLSPAYLEAEYTQPEWDAAFAQDPQGKQRKLIPVRVSKCKPTGMLAPIIYVDLLGLPQDDARAVLLGAFSERAKPSSMPAFPGAQLPRVSPDQPLYPGPISATSTTTAKVLVTLVESADHSRRLSASQRLQFIRQLNAILPQQFNMLLFAVNPPNGLVPPMPAPQDVRTFALLSWAEEPGGCGLFVLQKLLETILKIGGKSSKTKDVLLCGLGISLLLIPLCFVVFSPSSFKQAEFYLRVITALGGALVGAAIPGFLEIDFPGVRAGGALAIFALIFLANPPKLTYDAAFPPKITSLKESAQRWVPVAQKAREAGVITPLRPLPNEVSSTRADFEKEWQEASLPEKRAIDASLLYKALSLVTKTHRVEEGYSESKPTTFYRSDAAIAYFEEISNEKLLAESLLDKAAATRSH